MRISKSFCDSIPGLKDTPVLYLLLCRVYEEKLTGAKSMLGRYNDPLGHMQINSSTRELPLISVSNHLQDGEC